MPNDCSDMIMCWGCHKDFPSIDVSTCMTAHIELADYGIAAQECVDDMFYCKGCLNKNDFCKDCASNIPDDVQLRIVADFEGKSHELGGSMIASADSLLQIKSPEELFSGTEETAKREYRELAKQWHPDTNKDPKAGDVFARVTALYDDAVKQIKDGTWRGEGFIMLKRAITPPSSITFPFKYRRVYDFELGRQYVGDDGLVYVLKGEFDNFLKVGLRSAHGFHYASDRMRNEVQAYIPHQADLYTLPNNQRVWSVPKQPELLRLRDVLSYYGGAMDAKHVAWIMSTLHNLMCYLSYVKLAHGDISLDTYFISPSKHSGALLGGWWYTTTFDQPIKCVPSRTFNLLPWDVRTKKVASARLNLEQIRSVGRELLGDERGLTLLSKGVPKPMVDWLRGVSGGDAVKDYKQWGIVLKESFGERRFTKMELTADDLYRKRVVL